MTPPLVLRMNPQLTDPMGGIDLVFPFNDIQSPKAQSDTQSEDADSTSPDASSKSVDSTD